MLAIRLSIGLAQGLLLTGTYWLHKHSLFPFAGNTVFAVVAFLLTIIPLSLSLGLTERRRTLAMYLSGFAIVLAIVGIHITQTYWVGQEFWPTNILPKIITTLGFCFVAQALVTAADNERRLIAAYPRYFDTAWKLAVQLVLSGVFTGAFWLLLGLGTALFDMLGIKAFQHVIQDEWFAIPASAIMFQAGLHVTDVSPTIIRGVRTLKLTLFAWLLPVITLIAAAFLISLPIVGFGSLAKTHVTGYIFIGVGFILLYLINAAYQDGAAEQTKSRFLRLSGSLAALMLVLFSGIAAWRLGVRIGEDGLTPVRIFGIAALLLLACHACGYAWGVAGRKGWLKALEMTNVMGAFLYLALYVALFTALADPARLSVQDQMARLHAGKITAATFDYAFLKWDAGQYGHQALERLEADADPDLRKRALQADKQTNRWAMGEPKVDNTDMKTAFAVYPEGSTLPDEFFQQDWNEAYLSQFRTCPISKEKCDAFVLDLQGNGQKDILIMNQNGGPLEVFVPQADGSWKRVGQIQLPYGRCGNILSALRQGRFQTAAPAEFSGIEIDGQRYPFIQEFSPLPCR